MRKLKKIASGLLAALVFLTLPGCAAQAEPAPSLFFDVPADAWYAEAAAYMQERGLMEGVGGGNFDPTGTLSRAMMVTVLHRIAGEPEVTGNKTFQDVRAGAWYEKAVTWAQQENIVAGYSAATFGVDDPLTREQMATVLWRYAGSPAPSDSTAFADADSISGWAKEAVSWARENQVINGVGNNRFDPKGTANRAQLAQVLMNGIEHKVIDVVAREESPAPESGEEETPVSPGPSSNSTPSPAPTPSASPALSQTGFTEAVPAAYLNPPSRQGTVERLDYATKDYVRNSADITKTAYVYLPYGYDENDAQTRYNILYLMHGWGGSAGEYFNLASLKNVFDNMIEKGDMESAIIVSATFYNANSSTDFSSSIAEFRQFHRDFEEALMPAVEGKYHTYAASTSDADLKASRDHRAFGGFSLGSVTTWLEFCYDSDYIRYFLPMSGSCWYYGTYGDFQTKNNVDFIEQLVNDNNLDERGYFIYFTTGTQDNVKSQSLSQAEEMLARDIFTPEHFIFRQKDGGYHDFNAVREYLYNALPLFFRDAGTKEAKRMTPAYTADTKISDVMNDPAFGDYGRLIFPVNSSYYSGDTLGNLHLTWYNTIDPDKTVEIANTFKNHAQAGDTIFYDIYTEAEKAEDPAKRNTGLFFFKGNPGAKFAICNAGGGHVYVGAIHDSFPHALELSKMGYNAFALIYRPGWSEANEDLARAISFVFAHAEELEVDTDCYSLWGGSAGARIAAYLGSNGPAYYGGDDLPKAGTVVMQYTGHTEYRAGDPPTYACCGTNDGIASWRTMQSRLQAMADLGIPTEFHAYEGLPHGFGLGTGTVAEGWIKDAVAFWESNQSK